jgi:alpha-tubulin suppressor-like RCC1 family protein
MSVEAGWSFSMALKQDGTVWAWGDNYYGQLGDGTTTGRTTPTQVAGLLGATAIVTGHHHALALKQDGTVWAWGYNYAGQLGDGTSFTRITPVQVSGLSGITGIEADITHSLALKQDGTVWAWGDNYVGQLGDGTTIQRTSPVQVPGFSGAVSVQAGGGHSLALKQDGTVWTWGFNQNGQLGDGTLTNRYSPVLVSFAAGIEPLTYSATNTNSAQQNTVNKTFTMKAGDKLQVGTCNLTGASASGDTYLRLYGTSATQVAYNDDNCGGLASYIEYTAPTNGTYELRAGCFSSNSCSGTVVFKVTPAS